MQGPKWEMWIALTRENGIDHTDAILSGLQVIKFRCRILNNLKQFHIRSHSLPKKFNGHLRHGILLMGMLTENIRYCSTYKAGFTFWKSFKKYMKTSDYPYISKENVTFTVTRNPWHRLVSVWRDRFTLPKPGQPQQYMRRFCRGKSWTTLPSFREFIEECILANWNSNHWMDRHWLPTLDKCSVCREPDQLQFFIAQENMNMEAAYMLKEHAGITNASSLLTYLHKKVLRPTEGIEKGISAKYQDEYKTLTAEQINEIWNIYKYEIFVFDYPRSPFVDFPDAK